MKKHLLILFIVFSFILPIETNYAEDGIILSTSELNIKPGYSGWFDIIADNVAGRIDISSTNDLIATVRPSSIWVDKNTVRIYVDAISDGICYINIELTDVASYNETVVSGKRTIKVIANKDGSSEELPIIKVKGDADVNLENILDYLPTNKDNSIKIAFEKGMIIDEQTVKALVSSVSSFYINRYTNDDKLEFGLYFATENLTEEDINPNYTFKPSNNAKIVRKYRLKNYKILDIEDDGEFPKGTLIKVFVGDAFDDASIVNVYNFDHNEEILFKKVVKDGYIEFDLNFGGLYIFSESEIKTVNNTLLITSSVIVVTIVLTLIFIRKKKKL